MVEQMDNCCSLHEEDDGGNKPFKKKHEEDAHTMTEDGVIVYVKR